MVLIWLPFLLIFAFAARGDTSALHIGFHVSALTLLIGCVAVLRRGVGRWPPRFTQALGRLLQVSVGVSIVGHLLELGVAFLRLGQDGFRNRDTADLWQHGPHVWAANLTVPAMLISQLAVLALVGIVAARTVTATRRASPSP